MSLFGRSELGDTDDPIELVPGNVASLQETADGLRKLSNACQEAYAGVSKLDVGNWTGEAAEKFSSYFASETPKWRDAAEAFAVMGAHTAQIPDILGRADLQEIIHRDNLVVTEPDRGP